MFSVALATALTACNAHPAYVLQAHVSSVTVQRTGGRYLAAARLRLRALVQSPAHVPHDPGLLAHVRGHGILARRVAASSGGAVEGFGATAAQARSRLQQAVARLRGDAQRELDRQESVYDSVTEYGSAQDQGPQYGFPGGPDAKTACGRR